MQGQEERTRVVCWMSNPCPQKEGPQVYSTHEHSCRISSATPLSSPDPRSAWIFFRYTRPFSYNPYKKEKWYWGVVQVSVLGQCRRTPVHAGSSLSLSGRPGGLHAPAGLRVHLACTKLMWLFPGLCLSHSFKSGVYQAAQVSWRGGEWTLEKSRTLSSITQTACFSSKI